MKNTQILGWSITVALAGFLFGFDTVVISGADQPIQELWGTEGFTHTFFIMSMALWGTVIGAIFGGIPCDAIGRKRTLFWIGILYFASAIGSAIAWDPISFSFFRFIGGLGVGASSVAAPVYISEISSANNRGRLVALYQFNIVFGIFIAFFSNYFLGEFIEENAWRYMLGVEAVPALIYVVMVLNVPNSPRWLAVKKKDEAAARAVLTKIYAPEEVELQLRQIKEAEANTTKVSNRTLFSRNYSFPLMLAFLLAFFNQASGINFVLYFAPRLLEAAGIGKDEVLLQSTSIGAVNLVFTLLGMYLIDRMGRRSLMYIGSFGYITTLSVIAWGYATGQPSLLILSGILLFIASHAVGQGAVIWVFISEIFPNEVRANGQAFGSGTHWVFAALITLISLPVITWVGELTGDGDKPWPIFAFFAAMMVLQLLFVIFLMPETKGKSLEELDQLLGRGQEASSQINA